MAVYRDIKVEIPKEHVTIERQKGGKPALIKYVLSAKFNREKGYTEPKRTTIGHQVPGSSTLMHPTSQYKQIFPQKWESISNQKVVPSIKRIGMYAAVQAVNEKTGIRDILEETYGPEKSSSLIDYSMHSILNKTDVSNSFETKMRNELTYSSELRNDTYFSNLFENEMDEEHELLFKKKWAVQCRRDGAEEVWICIDGSNDDCRSKGVEIAEKGHAKSGQNVNIVSFSYAVTPEGKPVTYETYRGGLVDAKAMKKILDFLAECDIKVKGVILDRGYCDANVIKYLTDKQISYVIMVKGNPDGYSEIVSEYGEKIKMNAEYLIPGTYLFGVQKKVKLFKKYDKQDNITLFFDYQNGSERVTSLLKKINGEIERVNNSGNSEIGNNFKNLLTKEIDSNGNECVKIKTEELQKAINEKGLYSIITSDELKPKEIHDLYASRNASETQYMQIKSQLGYGVTRVHYTSGVRAKFTVGFIASVIRNELEQSAKKLGRTTNQMIQDIDQIEMQKLNDIYVYTHTESARTKAFFSNLNADIEKIIDNVVSDENDRIAGRTVAIRRRKTGPRKGSHHKKYDADGIEIKAKRGVPKGTKRSDINADGKERKKPGVAKGTKRGMYNKDGSLRKKPGPKVKNSQTLKDN